MDFIFNIGHRSEGECECEMRMPSTAGILRIRVFSSAGLFFKWNETAGNGAKSSGR